MSLIKFYKTEINNLVPKTALFCLFSMILFLGGSLSTLTSTNRLLYTSLVFLGFVLITKNFETIKAPSFFLIYIIFFVLSFLSILFARDSRLVLDELIPIIIVILIFIGLTNYIASKDSFILLLHIFIIALITTSFYYLHITSFNLTRFSFLPKSYNSIAVEFFLGFIFTIILKDLTKKKTYLFLSCYFALFVVAAASVKVIACLVLVIVLSLLYNFIFKYKYNFKINFRISLKSILIILFVTLITFGIYDSGILDRSTRRVVNTILLIVLNDSQYQEGAVGSVELRGLFIEKGIGYWLKSPIFGHGLNNYRYLFNEDYGTFTYSHSTPIELIVGLGIVGFGLFYFFLFWLFGSGLLSFWKNKTFLNYFLVVSFGCFIIIGLGQRMYADYIFFVFLSVYYSLLRRKIIY